MKRIALILFTAIILLITCSFSVSADSLETFNWDGLTWTIGCMPDVIGTQEYCTHNFAYVDGDGRLNYRLDRNVDPSGHPLGRYHFLEAKNLGLEDNFDIEFKCKFDEFGESQILEFYFYGGRATWRPDEYTVSFETDGESKTVEANVGYDWHVWRGEKRGDVFTWYMDDEELITYKYKKLSNQETDNFSFVAATCEESCVQVVFDYLKFQNYADAMTISPSYGTVYNVGDSVTLKASTVGKPSKVDYYVNGILVGSGSKSNLDFLLGSTYEYTLTNLKKGTYTVVGKASGEPDSFETRFYVKDTTVRTADITVDSEISSGGTVNASVSLSDSADISSVEYFVNGTSAGSVSTSPYDYSITSLPVGTASVYAKAYYSDGTSIVSDTEYVKVYKERPLSTDVGQEYDITYTSANASVVKLCDGQFNLSLTHSGDTLTYVTKDKTETISAPVGEYRVVVASGIAEVYSNGQFAFSFCMPWEPGTKQVRYTDVTNFKINGSGVKTALWSENIDGQREVTEEDINMGLYYSLEFDKTDSSSESVLLYDGEYEISLKLNGGIVALVQPKTGMVPYESKLADSVKPGYYRITVYRGLAQLFINNEFIASFKAPTNAHRTMVRRVMSRAGASNIISIRSTEDIFYFEDDFEGNNELDSLEYWYCSTALPTVSESALVTAEMSNGEMKMSGKGTYVLDVWAEDAVYKWNMRLPNTASAPELAEIAVVVRYKDEYNNIKLIYTYGTSLGSKGKWKLVETSAGNENVIASDVTFTFPLGASYEFDLTLKGNKLTFGSGNIVIFSNKTLTYEGNGQFGFAFPSQGTVSIDNLSYVGNGKVNSGMTAFPLSPGAPGGTPEFWEGENGEIVMRGSGDRIYLSSDGGETWTQESLGNAADNDYEHVIILQSGKVLSICRTGDYYTAYRYKSDFVTLESSARIQDHGRENKGFFALTGVVMQARTGRIFFTVSSGGEDEGILYVYYSDDEGSTWKETNTVLGCDELGGICLSEPRIVELPDGTIRLYTRTDRGFLHYFDSRDGGVNFDTVAKASQLMTPTTAFAIARDEDEEQTYYAFWEYDVSTVDTVTHQSPRSRLALAVSYDGCKTWDYIMEMDDRGPKIGLNHANANLRVVNGFVCATTSTYSSRLFYDDISIASLVYILDTSTMKSRERFANAHKTVVRNYNLYDTSDEHAVLPKVTGTAMIYGDMVPARVDDQGFVEAAVIAKTLGATLTNTANGVTLALGGGSIEFTKGSTTYIHNGNSLSVSEICLSSDGLYINPKVLETIFGKEVIETGKSYLVLNNHIQKKCQDQLENLVVGVSDSIRVCIDEFKEIAKAVELKAFFVKYKIFLNLYMEFTDASYVNMYNAYQELDLNSIEDYDTFTVALETVMNAEKGRVGQFLDELNAASEAGDVATFKQLITVDYADLISSDITTDGLQNPDAVFAKMVGITYYSVAEVEKIFRTTYELQRYAETGEGNTITLSTTSGGFDDWNLIRSNSFGGAVITTDSENIATLSARLSAKLPGKTSVETAIDGYAYQTPGSFGANAVPSGATVNSQTGVVTFDGDGLFTISGASGELAKSNTIINVFDLEMSTGWVMATFVDGYYTVNIEFTKDGANIGELPEELKSVGKLTYRVEKSAANTVVLVKAASAPDTDYIVLGSKTASVLTTRDKWFTKFFGDETDAVVSNVGIYAALGGVKYETGGYVPQKTIHYVANSTSGNSMQNFLDNKAASFVGNISVDSNGNLVIPNGGNNWVEFGAGRLSTDFDRMELDLVISGDTNSILRFEYCDSSLYRHTGNISPALFNGATTRYSGWSTGKFYELKLINQIAEFDSSGRSRTISTLYVKDAATNKWVCLANDVMISVSDTPVTAPSMALANNSTGTDVKFYIKELKIKTYSRPTGDYSYINNAISVPTVDYNFSFDYKKIGGFDSTEFVIGGTDYKQTIEIESNRIKTNDTKVISADYDIQAGKWYKFFGKVKMTPEKIYTSEISKTVKNTLSLYVEDPNGNVTVIFEDLPMLKENGGNGLKFRLINAQDETVELKNIRLYNGKALDVISKTLNGGMAAATVDILNDEKVMDNPGVILTGVYNNDVLSGAGLNTVNNSIPAFGDHRVIISSVEYEPVDGVEPELKFFMWKDLNNLVPVATPASAK